MRPDLIAQRVGGGTALPGIPTVPLPVENHFVELFRGSDGIVQQLVESGLFNLRKIGHHLFGKHGKIDPVGTDEIDPVKTA